MIRKLLFLSCVMGLFYLVGGAVPAAMAQTGTIEGTITDAQTGKTVPSASVFLEGTQRGSVSDANGHYSISNVPYGDYTLRVSFIGYKTKEVDVTVDQSTVTVDIQIARSTQQLKNIVVTAQGVRQTQRSIGSTVQEISGSDLADTHVSNFVSSLQGKIAGANVGTSPTLGGSSRITLRGIHSITGDNQPLIVVDGIPIDNSNFASDDQERGAGGFDYGNMASSIDPSNIKSVTVLKGASASALYGSRGANGVIKITTKDGSGQQGIGLTINQSVEMSQVYALPNYQNKYGGGANGIFQYQNGQHFVDYATDESWGPRLDGRKVRQWYSFDKVNGLKGQETPWIAHPNNVEKFFQTGFTSNTNIGIANGGDNYSYRLSLGRRGSKGVYPLAHQYRKNIGFNGQIDLSDKLSASVSGNYTVNNIDHLAGTGYNNINVFQQFNQFGQRQVAFGPDSYGADIMRPDGTARGWNWSSIAGAKAGNIIYSNGPWWERHKDYANMGKKQLYGKVRLTYDITDHLTIRGQLKTDYYNLTQDSRIAKASAAISNYTTDNYRVQETDAGVRLNFTHNIGQDFMIHAFVKGMVRYNDRHHIHQSTQGGLVNKGIYNIQNSVARPDVAGYYYQQRHDAILGQIRGSYQNMIYLTLSGRNEWASTLPVDNNAYQYYAATGSFVFTELSAFKNSNILSFGKIRASYSKTGNGADPYSLANSYNIGQPFGSNPQLSVPNTLNNANLKPEQTYSWEVGTNLKFVNNRIDLSFTYYKAKSKNQILAISVSRATGYGHQYVNAGQLNNSGIEAHLGVTPIRSKNFSWDLGFNFGMNNNKVVKLARGLKNYTIGTAPFEVTVNARKGHPYGEIVGTNFVYKNGKKVVDEETGHYKVDTEPQPLGSYLPDWTGSVSTTFHYKGFSASVAFDGQKGGNIFSISNAFGLYSGIFQMSALDHIRELGLVAEGVNPDGSPNTTVARPNQFFKSLFGLDKPYVFDASYIKLRNVRLAYTIPVQTFSGTPIHGIIVSAYGRNLATIFKNAPNFDPSTVISSSNLQGIESGRTPPQRTYGLSVTLKF